MVAYLTGEPGGQTVEALLSDPNCACFAHAVNFCEVFYDSLRRTDLNQARQTVTDLLAAGIVERRDMTREFWESVGTFKSQGRISLADCFCLAVARELSAELITSDHREFDPILALGVARIKFIC